METQVSQPRAIRNHDRNTRCASCPAMATVLLLTDEGEIAYSSCARHRACNERKMLGGR